MRDNSKGMIEILRVTEEDKKYFAYIKVPKDSVDKAIFKFGVSLKSYKSLKRILQSRPLDSMPGLKYQYFWSGSMSNKTERSIDLGIRCETNGTGKLFDYTVTHELASNLKWFTELSSLAEASHLKVSE